MRSFCAAVAAALAIAGGMSLPAEAFTGSNLRPATANRAADSFADRSTASPRVELARYVVRDDDDDDARPVRRWRPERRWDRPRHAHHPRHHVRSARSWHHAHGKYAGRYRKTARHAVHHRSKMAGLPAHSRRRAAGLDVPSGAGTVGMASFYWQGQRTANGEHFNPGGLTAAHRSLPFGTRVRVTHLGNGRSVEVRINDRGPFVGGRIIDLSRGAASVLGMQSQGVARVRVTVLGR